MTSTANTLPSPAIFRRPTVRAAAILLAIAWFLPFAIHLVPWSGARPLGAYLQPFFWTAFVAVYFHGCGTGLLVGLFAPALNLLVTGAPALKFVTEASCELTVFVVVAVIALRRAPRFGLIAPLGYVLARSTWALAQWVVAGTQPGAEAMAALGHSLVNGLPGIALLAAIDVALVRFFPKR